MRSSSSVGIFARHLMRDSVEIVFSLRGGDAGLERADDEEAVVAALGEKVVALDLLFIDHRHPEFGPEEESVPLKVLGATPIMVKGCLLRSTVVPMTRGIGIEAGAPESVAEHDVWRGVGPVFVVGVKEAAELRLNAEHVEVVAWRLRTPRTSGRCRRSSADIAEAVRGHVGEGGVARFEVEKSG